jgi:hypothetical protein
MIYTLVHDGDRIDHERLQSRGQFLVLHKLRLNVIPERESHMWRYKQNKVTNALKIAEALAFAG